MVSICTTLAKNTNPLPSIIKTAIGKRTHCPTLVPIQGTFASKKKKKHVRQGLPQGKKDMKTLGKAEEERESISKRAGV